MGLSAESERPELVQFGDLTPEHFERHPVWIQCHVVDYEAPWHDDTDEETFRPYLEALPADPAAGMLLVRADLILADGTRLEGFVTPVVASASPRDASLGYLQPQLFLPSERRVMFWYGALVPPAETRQQLYAELGRPADRVFPIHFEARAGLTTGLAAGTVAGFYHIARSWFRSRLIVER